MHKWGRLDNNHNQIVDGLRKAGCSVNSLAGLGHGIPDILVGFRGVNYLFEIKQEGLPPSATQLTDQERIWHLAWQGQVDTVFSLTEAFEIIGLLRRR